MQAITAAKNVLKGSLKHVHVSCPNDRFYEPLNYLDDDTKVHVSEVFADTLRGLFHILYTFSAELHPT